MSIHKYLRGASLAIMSTALLLPGIAAAQSVTGVVPGGGVNAPASNTAPAPATTGYAFIGDVATGEPANTSNLNRFTPVMNEQQYNKAYPAKGKAGWNRARMTTEDLCAEANGIKIQLYIVAGRLNRTDLTYEDLGRLYEGMPKSLKRHAAVMTVAQAVTTGFLCVLSSGSYCIAAAAGGVGNIVGIHGNLQMQLAHVKLSQGNIYATNTNTMATRTYVRATSMWVQYAFPACQKLGMTQVAPDWTLDVPPAPVE